MLFCRLLGTAGLVPRPLATWGVVGYALLLASAVLDIVGLVDTTGTGGLLYLPGGVWELLAFPGWLFAKGFGEGGEPGDGRHTTSPRGRRGHPTRHVPVAAEGGTPTGTPQATGI
jgi:hypothetical protein